MSKTITIESWFGPKEYTKDQFVEIWLSHAKELQKLDYDAEWSAYIAPVIGAVRKKAEAEFDAQWERENQ